MFDLNRLYNIDCMEAMKEIPDKFFQLAICDPPYGIGHDGQRQRVHNNPKHNRKYHARKGWDKETPPAEYFRELERVSVNQIIWGGNYFVPLLNRGTRGWVVWDKGQHGLSQSDCELASLERSAIRKGKRTQFYYCHPYSSYERGSNECQNKMIRRKYPKGTDFAKVTVAAIKKLEEWINNYPREILGWRTSEMLFQECVAALAISAE